LLLRRLRPGDLAAFQAYRALPEVGRYQGWSPMSDGEAAEFLSRMEAAPFFTPGEWVQLAIGEPDGTLAGDIGIFLAADSGHAEIGFTLAPAAQGRGLATAAVREALDLVFAGTGIAEVHAVTDERNAPSIRLLERLGFQRKQRRDAVFKGEPCIELVYVLRRGEIRR
jgi:ribosomal-protein-alanine N-acetyltransferase